MPAPVSALHFTNSTSPPHSVGCNPAVTNCVINSVEIDARQIDFVQRHDNRHAGGAGVADGFFGLRHHTVVGGHDQHGNIGDVRPAGPHFGECFVPRRIDEGDFPAIALDLVGPNVLRDAAAFAAGDIDADDA